MSVFYTKAITMMNQVGFYPNDLILDGKIHRFRVHPSDKKEKGWYVGYERDGRLTLFFNDWRRVGPSYKFVIFEDKDPTITQDDYAHYRNEIKLIQKNIRNQQNIRNETAALEAEKIWNSALISSTHPYLCKKGLHAHFGARVLKENLIVPVRDGRGKIWGVQKITPYGQKFFLSGMKKIGCFHLIGKVFENRPIVICEGFATGASFHLLTTLPVVVALDAGNLKSVTKSIRSKYKTQPFVFAADKDEHGVGLKCAIQAADKTPGFSYILVPAEGKDFNDMHQALGETEASRIIFEALCTSLACGREDLICPI